MFILSHRNVKVVGFGKAVYGMAVEVEKIIGKHIIEGIITVPKGLLQEQENVLSDSNIRFVYRLCYYYTLSVL